jgi:hypothetical protein
MPGLSKTEELHYEKPEKNKPSRAVHRLFYAISNKLALNLFHTQSRHGIVAKQTHIACYSLALDHPRSGRTVDDTLAPKGPPKMIRPCSRGSDVGLL